MSAATTVVHLVRHGEVFNPGKVLYGRLPGFRLSERGEQMAERVAEALAGRDITAIITSPLERARQTAAPLAAAHALTPTVDPRLIESSNVFEGRTIEAGPSALAHPGAWPALRNPFRPSWGEPYVEVAARVSEALAAARRLAAGHEAVLVSHQLPIEVTRRLLEGRTLWHRPDRRQCGLCSITSFTFTEDPGQHLPAAAVPGLLSVAYREPVHQPAKQTAAPPTGA